MSIVEVWHISVSLNINGSRERGLTDTDIYRKCKFQRVWTELNSEFVLSSKPPHFGRRTVSFINNIAFLHWRLVGHSSIPSHD